MVLGPNFNTFVILIYFCLIQFQPVSDNSSDTISMSSSTTSSSKPSASAQPGVIDYSNLVYPPVFEPETYSLSDPSTSLTLLRRRNNSQNQ